MPVYSYKARDRKGAPLSGKIEADNALVARRLLSQQSLIPIQVSETNALLGSLKELTKLKDRLFPVPFEEVLTFNQQLQTAYSVGIPMMQAIDMIADQTEYPRLKQALRAVCEDVKNGKFLAESMRKHPDVFDRIYITMVHAGEASGELDSFLDRLSFLLERRAENKAKIKSATFYPKLVFGFLLIVASIFTFVLLPKIKEFFDKGKVALPLITQLLLDFSEFTTDHWVLIPGLAISGFMGFRYFITTTGGRLFIDQLKLKLPVMGKLYLELELNSICFITETLIRSGITITETISILRTSMDNQAVAQEMDKTKVEVERGGRFADGLKKSGFFPAIFVNLLAMGEEAGRMDTVLAKLAVHYRREIDFKLTNLSKLLEPVLLLIIFTMVGFLALAVFLPIWQMSRTMR